MNRVPSRRGRDPFGIAPALALALALQVGGAWAQTNPPSSSAGTTPPATTPNAVPGQTAVPAVTIQSEPPGAIVTLRGPYEWVGQTPWRLYRDLSGVYEVEARLPGYETWRGDVVLGQGGVQSLNIQLGRRTRLKAAVRSLLVPGWGQYYQDEKTKGSLLFGAGVLSAGALLWTHEVYRDRVDSFNTAKGNYESASAGADRNALYQAVVNASNRADRAYDNRRIALGALAGVYALSFLDALIFPPGGEAQVLPSPARAEAGGGREPGARAGLGLTGTAGPGGFLRAGFSYCWR